MKYIFLILIVAQSAFLRGQTTIERHHLSIGVKAGFVYTYIDPQGGAFSGMSFGTNGYKAGLEANLSLPKSEHWSLTYEAVYLRAPSENQEQRIFDNGVTKITRTARFEADFSSMVQRFGLRYDLSRQRKFFPYLAGGVYHALIFNKDISQRTSLTYDPPEPGFAASIIRVDEVKGVNDFGTSLGFGIQKKEKGRTVPFKIEIQWMKGFGSETHDVAVGRNNVSTPEDNTIYYLYQEKVVNFNLNHYSLEITVFVF